MGISYSERKNFPVTFLSGELWPLPEVSEDNLSQIITCWAIFSLCCKSIKNINNVPTPDDFYVLYSKENKKNFVKKR